MFKEKTLKRRNTFPINIRNISLVLFLINKSLGPPELNYKPIGSQEMFVTSFNSVVFTPKQQF